MIILIIIIIKNNISVAHLPILNWANVSLRTYLEVFGEASWFLIGQTFLREPSWKYSSKLYSGSKKLRSTCSRNIRLIWRTLPLIGWEQNSPVDEEKIKMDDGVARFFTRFRGHLLICGRCSLVLETQNEIVVSWITLWGMMKVYWLDPTFSIMLSAVRLPQVRAKTCISLQTIWERSEVWTVQTMFGELKVQLRNES